MNQKTTAEINFVNFLCAISDNIVSKLEESEKQEPKFWVVWCPNGGRPPRVRHEDIESAEEEAARLATAHPESQFYVLESSSKFECKKEIIHKRCV